MRFTFAIIVVILASKSSLAQDIDPYTSILRVPTQIERNDNDEKTIALLKESYNAAHKEIRVRYNYWLQGIGDISGLLDSINRFERLRPEIEGKADVRRFAEQKLLFAEEIDARSAKGKSNRKFEALREIDESSAKAFRIAAEYELERLGKSETTTSTK